MSSVYVVCWIILQTFQTYFVYRQTMWTLIWLLLEEQSDIGPHCLQKWLKNHKQMTKQTTIVVIGSLRVKGIWIWLADLPFLLNLSVFLLDHFFHMVDKFLWLPVYFTAYKALSKKSSTKTKRQENVPMGANSFLLTLVLLNPDLSCLCKQCRSRSVGFWRSQLIWICTVCH